MFQTATAFNSRLSTSTRSKRSAHGGDPGFELGRVPGCPRTAQWCRRLLVRKPRGPVEAASPEKSLVGCARHSPSRQDQRSSSSELIRGESEYTVLGGDPDRP